MARTHLVRSLLLLSLLLLPVWSSSEPAAFAKGGDSLSMQYSPDGTSLYVSGNQGTVDSTGTFDWHSLGLRRINVQSGTVEANVGVGQQIWWSELAPDGSALYTLMPGESLAGRFACPCTLHRLDPLTLQSTAQRTFSGDASGGSPNFYILAVS